MIYTKSVWKARSHKDGFRVLVTRYYPRGMKRDWVDEWLQDLAPSAELLNAWKAGELESWDEYVRRYKEEMRAPKSADLIRQLAKVHADGGVVTLLCVEPEKGSPKRPLCHRHELRDMVLAL